MRTFKEALSNLISNPYALNIYFGKIVNKISEHRYNLTILNPIILTKLPSLYKFKIKSDTKINIENIKKPVSIEYIYLPNKSYDVMIYQYISNVEENVDKDIDRILKEIIEYGEDVHYKYNKQQ